MEQTLKRNAMKQTLNGEQAAEMALLKSVPKKPEMEYLQKTDAPTWFKTEKQAKEFMKYMEQSTGVRHVLYYGNYYDKGDDEIGGCSVIPFFLRDRDGTSIEEGDILYNKDGEQIQVVSIERKDLESYEAMCATQNAESVNFNAEALAKYWRHSPWTQAEQSQAKREQAWQKAEQKATQQTEKALSNMGKFRAWAEEKAPQLIAYSFLSLFVAVPIILPVAMYARSAKEAKEMETSASAPVEIPCTVTDLTSDQRSYMTEYGYDTTTYYYITLKDKNDKELRFRCPVELYESLLEGDNVTVIEQEKTASAFELFIYDGDYTGETTYSINGYNISDAVIVQ